MTSLQGRRILVTRAAEQAKSFTTCIEQQSGISVEIPLLSFKSIPSEENKQWLQRLDTFSWLFFTSSNGVRFFLELCERYQIPLDKVKQHSIAAVGEKTAYTLNQCGLNVDFIPDTYTGQALGKSFVQSGGKGPVFVVQGNLAKQHVVEELTPHLDVQTATMYETCVNVKMKEALNKALDTTHIDALTFTSPSTVQAFAWLLRPSLINKAKQIPCFCIGSTTEQEARQNGFTHCFVPDQMTVESMCDNLQTYFNEKGIDEHE